MKKITLAIIAILAVSACTSNPPKPPEPVGEFTPVNPIEINIHELKL